MLSSRFLFVRSTRTIAANASRLPIPTTPPLLSFRASLSSSTSTTTTTAKPKRSTGLVGIAVDPHARDKLKTIYRETLVEADKMKSKGLRDLIMRSTSFRLGVVMDESLDVPGVERKINCGQIEELVQQAIDELEMAKALCDFAG